jgi:hypothetical protein
MALRPFFTIFFLMLLVQCVLGSNTRTIFQSSGNFESPLQRNDNSTTNYQITIGDNINNNNDSFQHSQNDLTIQDDAIIDDNGDQIVMYYYKVKPDSTITQSDREKSNPQLFVDFKNNCFLSLGTPIFSPPLNQLNNNNNNIVGGITNTNIQITTIYHFTSTKQTMASSICSYNTLKTALHASFIDLLTLKRIKEFDVSQCVVDGQLICGQVDAQSIRTDTSCLACLNDTSISSTLFAMGIILVTIWLSL